MQPIKFKHSTTPFGRRWVLMLLICLPGSQKLMAHHPVTNIQANILTKVPGNKNTLSINNRLNSFADSVLIDAASNIIIRSFSDLPGGIRITHGVNVGSPTQVHYTYDLDKGMIVQVWRGRFLNASTMWIGRGDGSSRPLGIVKYLGKPVPAIEKLNNNQTAWTHDTSGTGFRPKGYILDASGRPTFRYIIYGAPVNDASIVMENGKGIRREITLQKQVDGLFMHLATGNHIELLGDGSYAIDDKSYYIRIDDADGNKPVIRDTDGKQELIIPIQKKLTYSIIF